MKVRNLKIAVILLFVVALAAGSFAFAKGRPGGGVNKPCKWALIMCLDVWDPVVCDNGQTYSNACYAKRACAKNCTPTGGGGVEF